MKGSHSEKTGRACDDCIETMFPEEATTQESQPLPPTIQGGTEGDHNVELPRRNEYRDSYHSLDGVYIRSEDCSPDTPTSAGATGMVRGFVEAGLNRVSRPLCSGVIDSLRGCWQSV